MNRSRRYREKRTKIIIKCEHIHIRLVTNRILMLPLFSRLLLRPFPMEAGCTLRAGKRGACAIFLYISAGVPVFCGIFKYII